ncbi:hypothetical protein DFJ73DRAFT_798684 [Zopfochytrium polystomum]|nr:hypothetical protein DFJ73DRAFT_798684 [Zopfochytrium polystomum]
MRAKVSAVASGTALLNSTGFTTPLYARAMHPTASPSPPPPPAGSPSLDWPPHWRRPWPPSAAASRPPCAATSSTRRCRTSARSLRACLPGPASASCTSGPRGWRRSTQKTKWAAASQHSSFGRSQLICGTLRAKPTPTIWPFSAAVWWQDGWRRCGTRPPGKRFARSGSTMWYNRTAVRTNIGLVYLNNVQLQLGMYLRVLTFKAISPHLISIAAKVGLDGNMTSFQKVADYIGKSTEGGTAGPGVGTAILCVIAAGLAIYSIVQREEAKKQMKSSLVATEAAYLDMYGGIIDLLEILRDMK